MREKNIIRAFTVKCSVLFGIKVCEKSTVITTALHEKHQQACAHTKHIMTSFTPPVLSSSAVLLRLCRGSQNPNMLKAPSPPTQVDYYCMSLFSQRSGEVICLSTTLHCLSNPSGVCLGMIEQSVPFPSRHADITTSPPPPVPIHPLAISHFQ